MQWHRSGLIATWEFYDEYIERKNGVEDQTLNKMVEDVNMTYGMRLI